ncbi:hypothetical protein [Streptomyces sp. NPDC055794]
MRALMDTMSRDDLAAPEFRDSCTEAVAEPIEANREHREPAAESGQVVDLMGALTESVEDVRLGDGAYSPLRRCSSAFSVRRR